MVVVVVPGSVVVVRSDVSGPVESGPLVLLASVVQPEVDAVVGSGASVVLPGAVVSELPSLVGSAPRWTTSRCRPPGPANNRRERGGRAASEDRGA
ncbi:hypothetical protein OV079_28755 [Nannocystis pusilla]|uniref:Uncharacterized protein n=1 Tax=Nannocystis pusilla TaxID=889268 RepID=A0A9X3ETI7_9BACT|nr:hypothetical protein [Nannocystis pusilla]MCY1009485.1 hypothetical protein [Nannocystis pusilla]